MAEKRAAKKTKDFLVTLNDKPVNLADAFPMRLRDWKELEGEGLSLTEMDGKAESVAKLVQHFMTKANPDITMEDVDEFVYLSSSKISQTGGTDKDVSVRIKKAQLAFDILRPLWKSTAISIKTKLWIFNSYVKAVPRNKLRKSPHTHPRRSRPSSTNVSGRFSISNGLTKYQP